MNVEKLCSPLTELAGKDDTALAAARHMRESNVGTLVVVDARRQPVGIVTDRDLVLRVLAAGMDPARTTVGDVMTANPRTVDADTAVVDALSTMRELGVRRIPVVDAASRLIGILSVDDALRLVSQELESLARVLGSSHPGSAPPALRDPRKSRRTEKTARRPARRRPPESAGLERAASDPQC